MWGRVLDSWSQTIALKFLFDSKSFLDIVIRGTEVGKERGTAKAISHVECEVEKEESGQKIRSPPAGCESLLLPDGRALFP